MNQVEGAQIDLQNDWLTIQFGKPQSVVSWAIIGGGVGTRRSVAWHRVKNTDLTEDVDPVDFFQRKLNERGVGESTVGFLTSAHLGNYCDKVATREKHWVRCIATVGMSNGVRVGAVPVALELSKVGTINLLVQTSGALTLSASLEAMSIAAEARTLAVLEGKIPSYNGCGMATGTGTDCIAVASAPSIPGMSPDIYAGKHTVWGQLIGQAVHSAVSDGIRKWKEQKEWRIKSSI